MSTIMAAAYKAFHISKSQSLFAVWLEEQKSAGRYWGA